jgi:hypothetical protein
VEFPPSSRSVDLSRATSLSERVQPVVDVMCFAPKLAAGHRRIAPRTPRAMLLPELAGLDHRVAHLRLGSFYGGDASLQIRPIHHTVTIIAGRYAPQGNRRECGESFAVPIEHAVWAPPDLSFVSNRATNTGGPKRARRNYGDLLNRTHVSWQTR